MNPVGQIMTPDPVTVSVETHATNLRSVFIKDEFHTTPIIYGNRLEGIISRLDMLSLSSTKSNIGARDFMGPNLLIATPNGHFKIG